MTPIERILFAAIFLTITANVDSAAGDTFGFGASSFQIDFVTIGRAGNVPDTTGSPNPAGAIPYEYRMGKYEISEQMIDKANALGAIGITKDVRGPDKPATSISWYDAARFVNWLNASTGHPAAYKFDSGNNFQLWSPADPGYDATNLYRNTLAHYFLPSADEWYKAAYYDPTTGVYYDYPTGSDNEPDGLDFDGDPIFDAVFTEYFPISAPNDVGNVGLLSPFGTAGQGGNVYEWEETDFDQLNDATLSARGLRGGYWGVVSSGLVSTQRSYDDPSIRDSHFGFRIASTAPEPSALFLFGMGALSTLLRRRDIQQRSRRDN